MNDWILASQTQGMGHWKEAYMNEHISSRQFTNLHKALLGIHPSKMSLESYLYSLPRKEMYHTIDTPDARYRTPLAWAVEFGMADSVDLLLRYGADPNQIRINRDGGYSPLIHIATAGYASKSLSLEITKSVRLLLQRGANVNAVDHEGWTPLHIAASWSSFEITDLLIEFGKKALDWQVKTNIGETILEVCDNVTYQKHYPPLAP